MQWSFTSLTILYIACDSTTTLLQQDGKNIFEKVFYRTSEAPIVKGALMRRPTIVGQLRNRNKLIGLSYVARESSVNARIEKNIAIIEAMGCRKLGIEGRQAGGNRG